MTDAGREDPPPPRRRKRWRGLVVLALAVLGMVLFDWNMLRGPVGDMVSARLERGFRIAGPLDVELWSLTPSLSAGDVQLDNASWGKAPQMLTVRELAVSVDLIRLLRGELVLPRLEIDGPRLQLEEDAHGQGNWRLGAHADAAPVAPRLRVGTLLIRDGEVSAMLPSLQTDLQLSIASDVVARRVRFGLAGHWRGQAVQADGQAGSLLDLERADQPYPVEAKGTVGATRFTLNGRVANLLALAGLDVDFSLSGRSLAELYSPTGVPLPATPPFRLAARLRHKDGVWAFGDIDGRVGRSDVAGTLTVDRSQPRQRIGGQLRFRRLDLSDLSGFIGARRESGQAVAPRPGKVLPSRPLGLEKIAAANVDVEFVADEIRNSGLPLDTAAGRLRIDDRLVSLSPLKLGLAHGRVDGSVELDTRQAVPAARLDMQAARLRLRDLMPAEDTRKLTTGLLGGRAKLAMRGVSVAELLGSANGEAAFVMNGGSTSLLLVRLANLDVANGLMAWLAGGQREEIRCVIGDFRAQAGVLKTQNLLMDSQRMLIRGEGTISLRDEALDLHLRAAGKDGSLLALRGPLKVAGSFAAPSVTPEALPLGGRIAASVGLGLVLPPLALLPLVQVGDAGSGADPCGAMLARVGAKVRQP